MLSPVLMGADARADDARSQIMKKLAADLALQAKTFGAKDEQPSKSVIWNENLSKLRPALNRQRQTLLTAEPLLGLLSSSSSDADVSNEVVGSIPDESTEQQPDKPMVRFRQKLARLATGTGVEPLTILHIGNSATDSNRFATSLRTILQKQYGSGGLGLIAPARGLLGDEEGAFEITKSGRWRVDSIQHNHKKGFGLSAMRAISRSSLSSMTLTSKSGNFDWAGVTIATGPSQGTFKLKVGDVEREFDAYAETPGSKLFKLSVAGEAATLHPGGGAQTVILNWATGRKQPGIRYMRFELLSNKSKEIQRLDASLVANDLRNAQPDLIVFDDFSKSAEDGSAAQDLVAQMRASAPQADVLYLAPDNVQLVSARSCLNGATAKSAPVDKQRAIPAGTSSWQWAPNRADTCAIEEQLQQGLVGEGTANLAPDYAARRAAALAKWLANPSDSTNQVAQSKIQ